MEVIMVNNHGLRGFRIVSIIAIIISVISLGIASWTIFQNSKSEKTDVDYAMIVQLRDEITRIDSTMLEMRLKIYDLEPPYYSDRIDLSDPEIQSIDEQFMLCRTSVEEHLTGIKVKGRVINATALRHDNVTFRITLGVHSKEFTINRISSGNSTPFSVYIPDVPIEESRYAKIEYVRATVWFQY